MLHTGITSNFLDDVYFFDMKKSTLFVDYIDDFDNLPNSTEGALMIPMFKWELYDNPKKLPQFFEHYNKFVERVMRIKHKELIFLTTSQHLAGFSVLADYDHTGKVTFNVMKIGPKSLLKCYDNPKNYGFAMGTFSDFFGIKGKSLTNTLLSGILE